MAVLPDADAPETLRYVIDAGAGTRLEPVRGSGVVKILNRDGHIGFIAQPWAVDASGKQVSTNYEVVGARTIVQKVHHRNQETTYPVVSDPKVSVGWGVYIYFYESEVEHIFDFYSYARFGAQTFATGMCSYAAAAWGGLGASTCAGILAQYANSVWSTIEDAYYGNDCWESRWLPNNPPVLIGWKAVDCSVV